MEYAIVQFKDYNKKAPKQFVVIPIKWLYYFNIKDKMAQVSTSYTCFFEKNLKKQAPTNIGEITDISEGKINGHFYKVYVIKTMGK